jgi:hypothetical protein
VVRADAVCVQNAVAVAKSVRAVMQPYPEAAYYARFPGIRERTKASF